jgi:Reverse transcriptase (RNA-dependent DNA polymerase)
VFTRQPSYALFRTHCAKLRQRPIIRVGNVAYWQHRGRQGVETKRAVLVFGNQDAIAQRSSGVVTVSERGTGQGSVISPLLANVYLHYVFDLWAERWRHREAVGNVIIVRYADDLIIGFELDKDARRFQEACATD